MQRLNKTKRQRREYKKLVGFKNIRDKYEECANKINSKNMIGVNTEFINYCHKTKIDSGIRCTHKNKYEFKWIQEVNELKKKLNK
tara:strand:- start:385 stop:639 length:255 start_codon:yes stop_codon:yes gene_type:complete